MTLTATNPTDSVPQMRIPVMWAQITVTWARVGAKRLNHVLRYIALRKEKDTRHAADVDSTTLDSLICSS